MVVSSVLSDFRFLSARGYCVRSRLTETLGEAGIGAQLCDRIMREARELGLAELWLFTIDACEYFARRGFETVGRDQAPAGLRATAQFSSLCPSTATIMRLAV